MEKLDLCRMCLANSMNASMLPSTKTMERTMRQFNMLYSVSAVHVQCPSSCYPTVIPDYEWILLGLQKVDFTADGLKLVCEPCWARIDDFRQFSMHVEDIHISYVRHFLKDDGTFNEFDDISQYYVQVDDIHNMYAKQLLKNSGEEKKFDYIEPFCVINVDESEANTLKNKLIETSTSVNYVPAENDQLTTSLEAVAGLKNETQRKNDEAELVAVNSREESMPDDDEGEVDEDEEFVDDEDYDGETDSSEEHYEPPINKASQKSSKKRTGVDEGSDAVNKRTKFMKTGLDFGTSDDRSILLLKYVQLKCDICSDRKFHSFSDVQRHFWAEHDQNGYVRCCNRKFRRLARILQHCQWHENPEAFK